MFRPVASLVPMGDNLIISFRNGGYDEDNQDDTGMVTDLHLFRFDENIGDLLHMKTDQSHAHDGPISQVDTLPLSGLFVSGSRDCTAKVWNARRQLLREIKFPEQVLGVTFLNENGDILVGHEGKVSLVKASDY